MSSPTSKPGTSYEELYGSDNPWVQWAKEHKMSLTRCTSCGRWVAAPTCWNCKTPQ